MAVLASSRPTLIDVARRLDPNGQIAMIAEVLMQYNEILDDIDWMEGNLPTGHQVTVRSSVPNPSFRLLNQGIVPAKSSSGQVVEGCAIMENRGHVDVDLAMLNGNTAAFRLSEDRAIIQGFNNTLSSTLIYGDTSVNVERFNGLASRYFSLGSTYNNSTQLIDGLGRGSDNTSIWLVGWGEDAAYGIYPKGSKAGLSYEDRGIQDILVDATNGLYMRSYVSWYQWKCGLCIKDYRTVVRICNIDVSDLLTASDGTDTSANILKYMSMALDLLPPNMSVRPVFYMNNKVRQMLRVKLLNKGNLALSFNDVMGPSGVARKQLEFYGVPCRRIDSILSTESQVLTS